MGGKSHTEVFVVAYHTNVLERVGLYAVVKTNRSGNHAAVLCLVKILLAKAGVAILQDTQPEDTCDCKLTTSAHVEASNYRKWQVQDRDVKHNISSGHRDLENSMVDIAQPRAPTVRLPKLIDWPGREDVGLVL